MMLERNVHTKVQKAGDLEIHVSTLTTPYGLYVEVREFIPSLSAYGRGITYPKEINKAVKEGLIQAGKKST